MSYIKQLEELLKTDVLLEVEQNLNELQEELKTSKKKSDIKDIKEEIKYMEQVKQYFEEVVIDIQNNKLTEDQAIDILEGLEDMRADNQQV